VVLVHADQAYEARLSTGSPARLVLMERLARIELALNGFAIRRLPIWPKTHGVQPGDRTLPFRASTGCAFQRSPATHEESHWSTTRIPPPCWGLIPSCAKALSVVWLSSARYWDRTSGLRRVGTVL
jgi:hypothetical protein